MAGGKKIAGIRFTKLFIDMYSQGHGFVEKGLVRARIVGKDNKLGVEIEEIG